MVTPWEAVVAWVEVPIAAAGWVVLAVMGEAPASVAGTEAVMASDADMVLEAGSAMAASGTDSVTVTDIRGTEVMGMAVMDTQAMDTAATGTRLTTTVTIRTTQAMFQRHHKFTRQPPYMRPGS